MNTAQQTNAFRPVATNSFETFSMQTTCDCCGRENLKKTVKISDGKVVMWVGVGCAAKKCGMSSKGFLSAQDKAHGHRTRNFLNAVCPEFAGRYAVQMEMVGAGSSRREQAFDRSGIIAPMTTEEARLNFLRACEAIGMGPQGDEPTVARLALTREDITIALGYVRQAYAAWKGSEARADVGSEEWFAKGRKARGF